METNTSLTIRGELGLIYDYAANVERWPEILPHYRDVKVLETSAQDRLVSMHCVRAFGPVNWPCKWQARQELQPDERRILFSHVSGPAKGMEVEWLLTQEPSGVQTSIRHWETAKLNPFTKFYWNRILGPVFISAIAEKTLKTIKSLVESGVKA